MNDTTYDVSFQNHLLMCMLKNDDLWHKAYDNLRVSDFGPSYLQFVYEVGREHFKKYSVLPTPDVLMIVLETAMEGKDPSVKTLVSFTEHYALATFLDRVLTYTPTEGDIKYLLDNMSKFWAGSRWNNVCVSDASSYEKLQAAAQLNSQMASVEKDTFTIVRGLAPVPEELKASGPRWGLGIPGVDIGLGGGLQRKQIGLIVAGTGVGKTTAMTGAMAGMTSLGAASFYVTLEMSAPRIQERYHGILGGIPANLFKQDLYQWPECYQKRYKVLTDPNFKLEPYGTICDMSRCQHGLPDIDKAISMWKDGMTKAGFNADQVCTSVYIDWLDRLSSKGITSTSKDMSEERLYFHLCEGIQHLASKHDVQIWGATQAKPEAKGKEMLTIKDTAWGYSKTHLMDAVGGITPLLPPSESGEKLQISRPVGRPKKNPAPPQQASAGGSEGGGASSVENDMELEAKALKAMPECNRYMNFCFLKTRDTASVDTAEKMYQDPTLKLWPSQAAATRCRDAIEANPYYGLERFI